MDASGTFELDDLYLNWTKRVKAAPRVVDIALSASREFRTGSVTMRVNVTDEYDPPDDMTLVIEHRLEGHPWYQSLLGPLECKGGVWTTELYLGPEVQVGTYHFRAQVTDRDDMVSDLHISPVTLEVLNNIPTAPEIALGPEAPLRGDVITVTITRSAQDVENMGLAYRFQWYRDGELVTFINGDKVPSDLTAKGQNWSVEVRAFDGDDRGPAATAWVIIGNSPTLTKDQLPDLFFSEDGEAQTLEISPGFADGDGDILTYGVEGTQVNLTVDVDEASGLVTLAPVADWSGEEELTFWASDGDHIARQTVTVNVTPVNDPPRFVEVNGKPYPSGIMVLTVLHGETLVIVYSYNDVEGDLVMLAVDTDDVTLDEFLREIRCTPTDDMVGTVTFTLTLWDLGSPEEKQTLEFQIVVENVNDPPGQPWITEPPDGSRFKVNESFGLAGGCDDPDIRFGQVLTFTWMSNISGALGTGTELDMSLTNVGTHLITLTVSDGEFERSATLTIVIEPIETIVPPPPSPPKEDDGLGLWIPAIVLLAIIGVALAVGASTEPGKYRLGLMFAPLMLRKDEVLDNKTRYALHGIIAEKPGIHYSAIKEEFGLTNGAAAYHL
ncbi:MAG: hypothetical protein KAJ35_09100, partial [Thermoplasmata archaeon]|nr:hypothetical protein [Thermoplasmata archaeon]